MSSTEECFACVQCLPENDFVTITFSYDGKQRDFERKKTDTLQQTLHRIELKLQPKSKKSKKNAEVENRNIAIIVSLLDINDEVVSGDTINGDSFIEGSILKINDFYYSIRLNPPAVTQFSLSGCIMAGFIIFPEVKFEFASLQASKFAWYRSLALETDGSESKWEFLMDGFTYTPCSEDISYVLKCTCCAGNEGSVSHVTEECVSNPVSAGPGICLFNERQLYTPKFITTSNEFRLLTYNILADVFADSDNAKEFLYPYCPGYAIKSKYRRQLLIKELLGYHADIMCLQECELKIFNNYLEPILSMTGYEGYLKLKIGEMPEGEALFYRKSRFSFVRDLSMSVREALYLDCNKDILIALEGIPDLLDSLCKKIAIGQIIVLRENSNDKRLLCILNTHLHYKPYAVCIRLLQISILLNYMHDALKELKEEVHIIVCGDLNTLKGEPLLDYLSGVGIKSSDSVWNVGEDGETGLNINLTCPVVMKNMSGHPMFTVFVPHFKATVDYIFAEQSKLAVTSFLPVPDPSEIELFTAVPCIVYPSDHFAVVLDFIWKE